MSNKLNLVEGLTPEDREWLRINGRERQMSPPERLITEGEALQEIYFVLSGLFYALVEGFNRVGLAVQ